MPPVSGSHAEATLVTYHSNIVSYEDLCKLFFETHNPEQEDRQGPDIGTQYRSEIFFETDKQKQEASEILNEFNKKLDGKIQTNISKIKNYCKAEEYHQKYIEKDR